MEKKKSQEEELKQQKLAQAKEILRQTSMALMAIDQCLEDQATITSNNSQQG